MSRSQTILIVDDAPIIISRLLELLEEVRFGENIYTASDFGGAVEILDQNKPDVVLLDIHLPGKNGFQLLKHIMRTAPETKVIMISNTANDFYRKLCADAGAVHFIDKSTEFETIPQVVESFSLS